MNSSMILLYISTLENRRFKLWCYHQRTTRQNQQSYFKLLCKNLLMRKNCKPQVDEPRIRSGNFPRSTKCSTKWKSDQVGRTVQMIWMSEDIIAIQCQVFVTLSCQILYKKIHKYVMMFFVKQHALRLWFSSLGNRVILLTFVIQLPNLYTLNCKSIWN